MTWHRLFFLPALRQQPNMPAMCVQVHTVGVGVAIGQACMLLSAGTKGKRFMLPHATGGVPCASRPVAVTCSPCPSMHAHV